MNDDIKNIQTKLLNALEILTNATKDNLELEVARSNSVAQLANTYIKSCNLIIRVNESNKKLEELINNEK